MLGRFEKTFPSVEKVQEPLEKMAIWNHINSQLHDLVPYQAGKTISEIRQTYHLEKIIKLASNECPLSPSQKVMNSIYDYLKNMARYPEDFAPDLRNKLAKQNRVHPHQITFGAGSSEVLELLLRTFTKPADNVIISQYGFLFYKWAALSANVSVQIVPEINYHQDLEATLAAINEKTRIIFIANINNPTGTWHAREALFSFIQRVSSDVLIVIDEAYFEYMQEEVNFITAMDWIEQYPNVAVTRTFSKAYGLAGLRFGYSVTEAKISECMNRLRKAFNVSELTLVAAQAALEDIDHLE